MKTNVLALVVTLTAGIILAGSLLMPVISDATETEEHIVNEGVYRMTDSDESYSLTYDPVGLAFIINGETYPFADFPAGRWTIISTDAFMFRFGAYANEGYTLFISDTTATNSIANTGLTESRTWTFVDGVYTGYDGVTTRNYTSESFRGFEPSGSYVMTNGTDKPIVKGDSSIIIGHGLTQIGGANVPFYIYGTVDDGVTVTTKDTITVSNTEVNAVANTNLVNCYTLNSITFTATDGTNTVNATYDRVIVPAEITAELSQHLNPGEIAIMNAIPFLIIAALVVMAAGALYLKRED